jgi:hypothetical protein
MFYVGLAFYSFGVLAAYDFMRGDGLGFLAASGVLRSALT